MDQQFHILSELSESLLEEVPQTMLKVRKNLSHLYTLLNNFSKKNAHILAAAEQKA